MSITAELRQHAERERFSPMGQVALLASIVISFLAASSAPTPLYERYDAMWHGTALTTTIAFAVYAAAVLVGLLTLAEVSNHVGRKQVVLAAIGTQAMALVLFATAGSFTPLFVGRVLQGLAAGAALGPLGAGMIDADRESGTLASAAAPGAGTGVGALLAGLVAGYLPWPTHLVYLVLLVVFAVQALLVSALPESPHQVAGLVRDLRPRAAVPGAARGAFLGVAPVLFSTWALAGLYGSLGPALVRELTGSASAALGGIALFVLAAVASVTTLALRNHDTGTTLRIGIGALTVGVVALLASVAAGSISGYLAATVLAGIGFGSGLQGSIRTVLPLARPEERPGLLSAVYLVSYVGMGAPAVGAGFLVSRGHPLDRVAEGYAAVLLVLALMAAGMLLGRREALAD